MSELGKRRIFVIATDPFPALIKHVTSGRNPAKRLAKQLAVQQFEKFCAKAITEANLTFIHSKAVAERFKNVWSDRCTLLDPAQLNSSDLIENIDSKLLELPDRTRPLKLVSVAGESAVKGMDHLLKAVSKVRRLGQSIELDLVGQAATSDEVLALVRQHQLEPFVRILGQASLKSAFAIAHVYVAASLVPHADDALPIALANGLTPIIYQGGPMDSVLTSNDCGVVLPRGETDLLSQALLDAGRDRNRTAERMTRAFELAKTMTVETLHARRAKRAMECIKS